MFPEGTLYVTGPHAYARQVWAVLDGLYPSCGSRFHSADDVASYAFDVPYPAGVVYTHLAALSELGFSGVWYPWNPVQYYNYRPQDERWVF